MSQRNCGDKGNKLGLGQEKTWTGFIPLLALLLLILLLLVLPAVCSDPETALRPERTSGDLGCPHECRCGKVRAGKTRSRTRGKVLGHRVSCNGIGLQAIEDLDFNHLADNAVHMILSHNRITAIQKESFSLVPSLVKLDLSQNLISVIGEGAFLNLTKLQRLDLSGNKITSITGASFRGLFSLVWLNLAENSLTSIPENSFKDAINSLKILDLEGNPLGCDCRLKWLSMLSKRSKNFRLTQKSTCHHPTDFWGVPLGKMRKQDMHCAWPVHLASFEITPNSDQLVFEGDAFSFQCRVADSKANIQLIWLKDNNALPEDDITSSRQSNGTLDGNGLYLNSLTIKSLQRNHSGSWSCLVVTPHGNDTKAVNVVVVTNKVNYCPQVVTADNKGTYEWPVTLAGVTVHLPCVTTTPLGLGYQVSPFAAHSCSAQGVWEQLNTSSCSFISEATKVLEQFAKTNLTLSQTNGLDSARALRNYTRNGVILKDTMDVIFISQTVHNHLEFVPKQKEVAEVLVDIINAVMKVDPVLLEEAEKRNGSASRLVRSLASLSQLLADNTVNRFGDNLAIEEFIVKSEAFPGITCSSFFHGFDTLSTFWKAINSKLSYSKRSFVRPEKALHCSLNSGSHSEDHSTGPSAFRGSREASISLPSTLFQEAVGFNGLQEQEGHEHQAQSHQPKLSHKLQFTVFRSSSLFPVIDSPLYQNQSLESYSVTSFVVGCRVAFNEIKNLKNPVEVSLRVPLFTDDIVPVYWDEEKHIWSRKDCYIVQSEAVSGTVRFKCHHLGHYSVMQGEESLRSHLEGKRSVFLRLPHASLLGSLLSLPCLLFVILVYVIGFSAINMQTKTKHALINTWLSLLLLLTTFTLGVNQVKHLVLCQAIGLMIHYLTVSCLLWMLIGANIIYRSVSRHRALQEDEDKEEDHRDDPRKPKSLLGSYLLGYGVGLILCSISSAISLTNYSDTTSCFVRLNPALAIIYGPVIVLVLGLCVFLLLIGCLLKGGFGTNTVSPGIVPITGVESISLKESVSKSVAVKVDNEWSFKSQLVSQTVVFILFILMWTSMAMAIVVKPLRVFLAVNFIPDETLFGSLYSSFSCLLSFYVVTFFCLKREDLRLLITCRRKRRVSLLVTNFPKLRESLVESVSNRTSKHGADEEEEVVLIQESQGNNKEVDNFVNNLNNAVQPMKGGETSFETMRSMGVRGSSRASGGGLASEAFLTNDGHQSKSQTSNNNNSNNCNMSFPGIFDETNGSTEVFLNPRLNAIAKRFFEKNRRRHHLKMMMERNNLNIDTKSDFTSNCSRKLEKGLLSPKLSNFESVCSSSDHILKARSEIVPLSDLKERVLEPSHKHRYPHRSPCSSRKCSVMRSSCSARDMNIYSSSPNVDSSPGSGAIGGQQCQSITSSHSSSGHGKNKRKVEKQRKRKGQERECLKMSTSIPAALQRLQSPDQCNGSSINRDKDKSESLSVCCQSDILSSVSHPWSASSRRSRLSSNRQKTSSSTHSNKKSSRTPTSHRYCECCHVKEALRYPPPPPPPLSQSLHQPKNGDPDAKESGPHEEQSPEADPSQAQTAVTYTPKPKRRRRRRLSARSTDRSAYREERVTSSRLLPQTKVCDHFPRSRSVSDQIPVNCNCRQREKYCSSSD